MESVEKHSKHANLPYQSQLVPGCVLSVSVDYEQCMESSLPNRVPTAALHCLRWASGGGSLLTSFSRLLTACLATSPGTGWHWLCKLTGEAPQMANCKCNLQPASVTRDEHPHEQRSPRF